MWRIRTIISIGSGLLAVAVSPALSQTLVSRTNPAETATGGALRTASSISDGGQYVVFVSSSDQLVGSDTNNEQDVFVFNRATGAVTRVSESSVGVEANSASGGETFGPPGWGPGTSISRNGRYVVFNSHAWNLVAGDTNNWPDVFLRDRDTDGDGIFDEAGAVSTVRVSLTAGGGEWASGSEGPVVSNNGRYVTFRDSISVWRKDLLTGAALNVSSANAAADHVSTLPSMTSDGRYVVYTSNATNLVGSDTNGWQDVFRYDSVTNTTIRVSLTSGGAEADLWSVTPPGGAVSDDGRHVVFESGSSNLVSGDTNGKADVFVRDIVAATTARVSLATDSTESPGTSIHPSMSANGRFVVFRNDASGNWRVYVHDRDADADGIYDENGATSTSLYETASFLLPAVALGYDAIAPTSDSLAISTDFNEVAGDTNFTTDVYLLDIALDTDGDGLPDAWETTGIDANNDGTIDLQLNSNPNKKTLFVEVDSMTGLLPTQATLNGVISAFANSPVTNPSGTTGIDLVIVRDESNIPIATWSWDLDKNSDGVNDWPSGYDNAKSTYFGTMAERANGNWANIRAAKLLAFRYCIFGQQFTGNTVGGLAEMPGNDCMVMHGGWNRVPGSLQEQQEQQGLFMHELGHTLGLHHGGNMADGVNYKPNHVSVMNYTWTVPALVPVSQGAYAPFWTLDYSSTTQPWLEEVNGVNFLGVNAPGLNEATGIGGRPGALVPVGPPVVVSPGVGLARLEPESGPVDWNNDGVRGNNVNVTANANYVFTGADCNSDGLFNFFDATPGEVLFGHDDWNNLWLRPSGHANFAAGVHGNNTPGTSEISLDIVEQLAAIGDCNANGVWDETDILGGLESDLNLNRIPDSCEEFCGPFVENFELYTPDSDLFGQGGWSGWEDDPAFSAPVTGEQAHSGSQSVKVQDNTDLVFEGCLDDTGAWSYSGWQYIHSDFESGSSDSTAGTYFLLLNTYESGGPYHWSVQMQFDSNDGLCKVLHGDGTNSVSVPYETDRWVKIQTIIDLEEDWTRIYYDDELVTEYVWTGGVLGDGGGALDIAAVDLYANGSSKVYYDDLRLDFGCGPYDGDPDSDGLDTDSEFRIGTNSCEPDTDFDGHLDGADNCPTESNSSQTDADSDGYGDACDTCDGFDDALDCNGNALPDGCDILEGVSEDQDGSGIPDECETPTCGAVSDCCDMNGDNIIDDGCQWCDCVGAACTVIDTVFADRGGAFGTCQPDGFANIHDRNHALSCFGGLNTCESINIDAGGAFGACPPDGFCNIHDANHALSAFAGTTTCSCPAGPAPQWPVVTVDQATLRMKPHRDRLSSGDVVEVEVYLDDNRAALQSMQLHIGVSGGRRGHLRITDLRIEARKDFVLNGVADFFEAVNVKRAQILAGHGDVENVGRATGYVATITLQASRDAAGEFVIDLRHDETNGDQTFLVSQENGRIEVLDTTPAIIFVEARKR
jgi:hypothetical protein